ncbi:hypothetical protein MJO28_011559 [Puccinia striiformis f. sp. tritici]|uniref:Uncharacterized protein n=1 Tax=Puccinia striiformis f. sp. tritici TaxID=168172 RepID=A0ACC0E3V1_9BASI|nr:hypothetical protein MJO28_011559 [Puccinia striiformis f. sp. tritici]
MTDSSDDCCRRLDPHPLESDTRQAHRQQGDLVIQGFEVLARKCFAESNTTLCPGPSRETLAIDPIKFKNALLTQLGSSILPLPRQQLTTLSDLTEFI